MRVNLVRIGCNNSRLLNRGAYWYWSAWNESAYTIGILIRMGALINKNTFQVSALVREWALIGMKLVRRSSE